MTERTRIQAARWWVLAALALWLGCEGWSCEGRKAAQDVDLESTEWQAYALSHLRDREFDSRDWEPLFRVLEKEPLDERSLDYAVAELFKVASAEQWERLLTLLQRRASKGDVRYARLAAFYHLQAAMRERHERGGASPEAYTRWLEQALVSARQGAQAGDTACMRLFGEIVFFDSSKLAAHRAEALTWLRQAAERGDAEARKLLQQSAP